VPCLSGGGGGEGGGGGGGGEGGGGGGWRSIRVREGLRIARFSCPAIMSLVTIEPDPRGYYQTSKWMGKKGCGRLTSGPNMDITANRQTKDHRDARW